MSDRSSIMHSHTLTLRRGRTTCGTARRCPWPSDYVGVGGILPKCGGRGISLFSQCGVLRFFVVFCKRKAAWFLTHMMWLVLWPWWEKCATYTCYAMHLHTDPPHPFYSKDGMFLLQKVIQTFKWTFAALLMRTLVFWWLWRWQGLSPSPPLSTQTDSSPAAWAVL